MTIIKTLSIIFITLILFESGCKSKKNYVLVWSDEFNYEGLPDSQKWSCDTIGKTLEWDNNEMQYNTCHQAENIYVSNGVLSITVRKASDFLYPYTSSRITSKGKGDWLYGRIEVMAKIPGGLGLCSSIRMLPTDWEHGGESDRGEINIMEHFGYEPDSLYFSIHTQGHNHTLKTRQSHSVFFPDGENKFHLYAVEWEKEQCTFFVDKTKVFTYKKESGDSAQWPFNKRFYILLNVAVGGSRGGRFGIDDSIFPKSMEIDYVRVYKPI